MSLAIAILLGLLLSCGYVVLKELLHKTIRSVADVKQFLELPVLGMIPDEEALDNTMATVEEPNWKDKLKEFIWKD